MLQYLIFVIRQSGEISDTYGETLVLSVLRLFQDCPANGVHIRKVTLGLSSYYYFFFIQRIGIDGPVPPFDEHPTQTCFIRSTRQTI
jgi:hypothetical protein